ncbi:OmpA family protein [Leifsonia shinshuensis]|uniref:Outer membrane protein OmpA-like peptidoglycan-associated protein n=1 Tax=Leifsonia shinshuensis TaxID=150026 RepID=A0A853CY40_9MICO|nr:OmpA family protein [Leifsonia shinshuensis]NYJ24833.1 outer membrane protein OmpA-like peptidoglycan-associated protein [Leifsonia shinshuensis]
MRAARGVSVRRPRARSLRTAVAVAAVLAAGAGLAACTSATAAGQACDQSNKRNLGVVAGSTANAPAITVPASATAQLKAVGATNGSVTVVVPSGTPQTMGTTSLGSTAQDAIVCQNDQRTKLTQIGAYLAGLKAATPEVDFLGAIGQAARDLGDHPMGVLVIGSGLQTADPLNFAGSGLLYADPAQVVSDLRSRNLLPTDLKGVTVYWSGLGDTAGAQQPLTVPARSNLAAIWTAVVKAAGGTLSLLPEPASGPAAAGLPAVTPVPVEAVATKTDWSHPVVIRNSDLHFVKDTATFSDPSAAQQLLSTLAPSIEQSSGVITITGTASKDQATNNTADTALSLRRANAVKAALVALGVPEAKLATAGVGFQWCGWQSETDASGSYSDALAEQNRSVILTSAGVSLCG